MVLADCRRGKVARGAIKKLNEQTRVEARRRVVNAEMVRDVRQRAILRTWKGSKISKASRATAGASHL